MAVLLNVIRKTGEAAAIGETKMEFDHVIPELPLGYPSGDTTKEGVEREFLGMRAGLEI